MPDYVSSRDVIAISLAGGKGERLGPLTWFRTKPAIMFGDSILAAPSTSNAYNSGVSSIVMATQYRPYSLKGFYSTVYGADFGPQKKMDLITPLDTVDDSHYRNTSDAMFHALKIANRQDKKYVLSLSGDHIYTYDFNKLFDTYKEAFEEDSFIILSQKVPRSEASNFGILTTDGTRVTGFTEKPKKLPGKAKDFDASMGIYFAPTHVWNKILKADQQRGKAGESKYDLGGDVIPWMIKSSDVPVHTLNVEGFWADVGRTKPLYDVYRKIMLDRDPDILGDDSWPIERIGTPKFRSSDGETYFESGDLEANASELNGSIFSPGVTIDRATVLDSIVLGMSEGKNVSIGLNSTVQNAIIDKMVEIDNGAAVVSKNGIITAARGTHVPAKKVIEREGDAWLANLDDMALNYARIIKYFKNPNNSPVELITPSEGVVTVDELYTRREELEKA